MTDNKDTKTLPNAVKLNVAYVSTEIVTTADLVATPPMIAVYELAKATKLQLDAQDAAYKALCNEIRKYMGKREVLLAPNGARIATYIQAGKQTYLDKDTLELMYPQVYKDCLATKDGNRSLLLK